MEAAAGAATPPGASYADAARYERAVFDAGRAYSLFKRDDPHYDEIARATVDIATRLHYDPLLNDDASLWYVREAADWVSKNGALQSAAAAADLIAKVNAETTPMPLALDAETDARRIAADFKDDPQARSEVVVAEVRAYNLTRERGYRSLALLHASDPAFPFARLPESERSEIIAIANSALSGDSTFSQTDVAGARAIVESARTPAPRASSKPTVDPNRLRNLAPADEYFGRMHLSPLSVRNEILRINLYLDAGWGTRMTPDALNAGSALDDWQRQYPHDPTLPAQLLDFYRLLQRVGSPETLAAAKNYRDLILVQYAGTLQARQLAASDG